MIQEAPYQPDLAPAMTAAPIDAHPVAFLSDPARSASLNRYSILTAFPLLRLSAESPEGPVRLQGAPPYGTPRAFPTLKEAVAAALSTLEPSTSPWPEDYAPFTGGLAGYLAFEFGGHFERMPRRPAAGLPPLLRLGLYPSLYVADHAARRAWWVDRPVRDPERRRDGEHSRENLRAWLEPVLAGPVAGDRIALSRETQSPDTDWGAGWEPSLDPAAYRAAFDRIQRYLRDGDIYQANLTVRFRQALPDRSPDDLSPPPAGESRTLRAFLGAPDASVLSSSPELLLDLRRDGRLETRPIKGTVGMAGPRMRRRPGPACSPARRTAPSTS
jgi:para-aminobenzoate synthetase component I